METEKRNAFDIVNVLISAIKSGEVTSVNEILAEVKDENYIRELDASLLQECETFEMFNLLLEYGFNMFAKPQDPCEDVPIHCLVKKKLLKRDEDYAILSKHLIDVPFETTSCWNLEGDTLLHSAIESGDIKLVETLLRLHREFLTCTNKYGRNALFVAIECDNLEIVRLLVENGADLGSSNVLFVTDAHDAYEIRDYLSTKGINIKVTTTSDAELIRKYSDLRESGENESEDTIFHFAAKADDTKAMKVLLEIHPDFIESKNLYGFTPIFTSLFFGAKEALHFLIDRDANLNETDNARSTPAIFLLKECPNFTEKLKTLKHLISKGAKIHAVDYKGHNCLYYAVMNDEIECLDYLLSSSEINMFDLNRGRFRDDLGLHLDESLITPLKLAESLGNDAAASLLRNKESELSKGSLIPGIPQLYFDILWKDRVDGLQVYKPLRIDEKYFEATNESIVFLSRSFSVFEHLARDKENDLMYINGFEVTPLIWTELCSLGILIIWERRLLRILRKYTFDQICKLTSGRNIFQIFAKNNRIKLLQVCYEYDKNFPHSEDDLGNIPLIYAIKYEAKDAFDFLLPISDLTKRNNKGLTPLLVILCAKYDNTTSSLEDFIVPLIESGSDLMELRNFQLEGMNYLHLAAKYRRPKNAEILKYMLFNEFDGCGGSSLFRLDDLRKEDADGKTPAQLAEDEEIKSLLILKEKLLLGGSDTVHQTLNPRENLGNNREI